MIAEILIEDSRGVFGVEVDRLIGMADLIRADFKFSLQSKICIFYADSADNYYDFFYTPFI